MLEDLAPSAPGRPSPGRHCHSTLLLTAIGCHSVGIHTAILLPLLSLSAKMTASPMARQHALRRREPRPRRWRYARR
jgi:hypothetical protein